MLKLILSSLFLILIGAGTVGCKKENVRQNEVQVVSNEFGVATNGKMLIFNSIDGYMKAVDGDYDPNHDRILKIVNDFKFDNYFSNKVISAKSGGNQMDDFLGQLLDKNGCIEIQNNIYKVDLLKEKVFVISKDKYAVNNESFANGTLKGSDVKEFNLNEDVLDIMNNGGFQSKASCPSPGTITSTSYTQGGLTPTMSNTIKLGAFGVYFRVTGRTQLMSSYSGYFTLEFILTGNNTQIHRRPCNNTDVTWHYTGTKATWVNPGNNEQVWEAYSKAWNVKQMYMQGRTRGSFGHPILDPTTLIRETNDAIIVF
jgi:hypothetical protein